MTVSSITAALSSERTERTAAPAPAQVSDPAAAEAFEKSMPAGTQDDIHFRHQSSRSAELRPLQKFESFVLRSFIENMLPSQNTSFFGTGTAGNIWRSMLAERIGDEMAASGGVGIADMIEKHGRAGLKDPASGPETT